MIKTEWILLETETTGFRPQVYVVKLAAQRMRGWEPLGEPFHKLLNQNQDIPPESTRLHGYTREILERDGEPASDVYRAFAQYAGSLPLVSYNTPYDLDEVLRPEWARLGVQPIGSPGFCALRLVQRLLDPVPAGNCKLQTLRQYYGLPEHGGPAGLGDLMTVVDLMQTVLRPVAEERGLTTWGAIADHAAEEWYPSRIAFGAYKGKSVWDACENRGLRDWLESLARSSNQHSAIMGRWYLRLLETGEPEKICVSTQEPFSSGDTMSPHRVAVVVYENPEVDKLRTSVDAARSRLADLEAAYTVDKAKVDHLQALLFKRLRPYYQQRDRLELFTKYRSQFLETLLRGGEEEAMRVEEEFRQAEAQTEREYEETAKTVAEKKEMSAADEEELGKLWRKLVKLYHPDRFTNEPKKLETYAKLTAVINGAKEHGDLETLREIASDPECFILRNGWAHIDFDDDGKIARLRKLWESLEMEIVRVLEAKNQLRESPEFELHGLVEKRPELLDEVAAKQAVVLETEIEVLKAEANRLAIEIEELTGQPVESSF